tara:strand:- start:65 stop:292 length:228 start_codon:yes stop_codon:yes gene_type:complete
MKALISINDIIFDYEGNQGQRILEIVADDASFPVNSQMTWIDISDMPTDDIPEYVYTHWYVNNAFSLIPQDTNLE